MSGGRARMRADDADVLRLHVPRAARVARLVAEYGVPTTPARAAARP